MKTECKHTSPKRQLPQKPGFLKKYVMCLLMSKTTNHQCYRMK